MTSRAVHCNLTVTGGNWPTFRWSYRHGTYRHRHSQRQARRYIPDSRHRLQRQLSVLVSDAWRPESEIGRLGKQMLNVGDDRRPVGGRSPPIGRPCRLTCRAHLRATDLVGDSHLGRSVRSCGARASFAPLPGPCRCNTAATLLHQDRRQR
jgi:hypothetical protein